MVQYLLFSDFVDEDTGNLVLPYKQIYRIFGLPPYNDGKTNPVSTEMLLRLYRDSVDRLFKWDESHSNGKARTVTRCGIPEHILKLADRYRYAPDSFDAFVYLINGRAHNRPNRKRERERREEAVSAHEPTNPPPESAKRMWAYLNGLSHRFFNRRIKPRIPDAMQVIRERPRLFNTAGKRRATRNALARTWTNPKPMYLFCDNSPRLKADSYNGLMNLKREVRPYFYTERDVELDLSKAHLACFVRVAANLGFDMPVTTRYLRAHQSGEIDLWEELAGTLDLPLKHAKKAVKRMYAAVYGGDDGEVLRQVSNEYANAAQVPHPGFDPFRPLLKHPLVEEILETSKSIQWNVVANGGLCDASGRFIGMDWFPHKEYPERTVMSYVAASYELELVAAAFDEAIAEKLAAEANGRKPKFRIWLYQSDGFTVWVRKRRDIDRVVERLQQAVSKRASELGIITGLDKERVGPPSQRS